MHPPKSNLAQMSQFLFVKPCPPRNSSRGYEKLINRLAEEVTYYDRQIAWAQSDIGGFCFWKSDQSDTFPHRFRSRFDDSLEMVSHLRALSGFSLESWLVKRADALRTPYSGRTSRQSRVKLLPGGAK